MIVPGLLILNCSRTMITASVRYSHPLLLHRLHTHISPLSLLCCYSRVTPSFISPLRRFVTSDRRVTTDDGHSSQVSFHKTDRLDRSEWVLIYHNKEYERSKNMIPPMIIFGVFCILVLTFTLILVWPDLKESQFEKSDWLFVGWPVGIGSLIWALSIYRRRFVVRLYQRRPLDKDGKRRYCIVWLNWCLIRRRFMYDHTETSRPTERHAALAAFTGNYKARNRSWYVKAASFDHPQDYFLVRVRHHE